MGEPKLEARPVKEAPPRQYGPGGEAIFDNRVHIRDADSGRLHKRQPYAYHAFGTMKLLERPVGSGNMFDYQGKPIGRWALDKANGHWNKIADTHAEKPSYELMLQPEDLAQRNSELEAEIAALKADMEQKTAPIGKHGKAQARLLP